MPDVQVVMLGRFSVVVDGAPVDDSRWTRRHAAALVKVLALAHNRRLHREQVLDLLWPDDTIDRSVPKLHKATHYARHALAIRDAIVTSGEHMALFPDTAVSIDVLEFESLSSRALMDKDASAGHAALSLYGGPLLPDDRYDEWAEDRREQLRLRHLDLLRLLGRWETVIELDESDEIAHLALMQRHAANGDRHAALRQFERMDRALRTELGVAPGPEAVALRDRLLVEQEVLPRRVDVLVGRDREMQQAEHALVDAAAGSSRVIFISGGAGSGKSAFLDAMEARAKELRVSVGRGTSARVEGAWPYAPVMEALAHICRQHPVLLDGLADHHREEIERALAGGELTWTGTSTHQRLFVAAAELIRLASTANGLLLVVDDIHEADDASLRLLHYIARSMRDERVCLVLAQRQTPATATLTETRQSLVERHGALAIDLGPLDREAIEAIVRRHIADPAEETVERIAALSRGMPYAVKELARRAASEPRWVQSLDANLMAGVAPPTRDALQRVAVVGSTFDTDDFVALAGVAEPEAFDLLDDALASAIIEPTASGYRFCHGLVRDALLEEIPPHRRLRIHRDAADRLIELNASPARIGFHLLEAGATVQAVPYLLTAAETEAAVGAYRDALDLVDSVRPHANGVLRSRALALRADLLNAVGDPLALAAYREAIEEELDGTKLRVLRVRLARCAIMSGDLDTATASLEGLELNGGEVDADILLVRGQIAYFNADLEGAQAATDAAQPLILAGERTWKVLDLVTLQGLLAHQSGGWSDRMRLELMRTRDDPELANAIFDGYLCAAEYMLYGPTPYAEVIAVARDLQTTAQRSGALRAAAFASAFLGEAALLSGDLDLAATALIEASELHHDLASGTGEAHSLQRLAEVRVAQGDHRAAMELLERSLPLARSSIVAKHLLQRVFGTMVAAAPDPVSARAIVDRAEATLGWDDQCTFCSVMFAVPAVLACVDVGDHEAAHRHLATAKESTTTWEGTSWQAAVTEAEAVLAAAEGDLGSARSLLESAGQAFARAGQPLDAERCEQRITGFGAELERSR